MTLAVSKRSKPMILDSRGNRMRNRPSRLAILPAAYRAAERGKMKATEDDARKRAQLMIAAKAGIYVSEEIPQGKFTVIDPESLEGRERVLCPFKVKTLVVHPDDIDQAIKHFGKEREEHCAV